MQDPMKVAFIMPGRGRSGGVRATVVAANHLLDRGHNVRILFRTFRKSIRGMYRSMVFPFIHPGSYDWMREFRGKLGSFKDIAGCEFDDDEIIVGAGMWASSQLARLDFLPNPKLQYLHGEHIVNREETERALRSPIPKIAVASFLKPLVESYGGEVLGIIPNGVDCREYFSSINQSERDGIGAIYASHVSKDPETILAVLGELSERKPEVPLRVFSPHPRPQQIPRSAFWRLPSVEKARVLYSKSLVWILASRSEGFGMPILEAMSCGCAVVATDCGGPRDIIRDGENGFLVEVGNVGQIVDRVLLLLNDTTLRKCVCLKAQETLRRFSWESSIDKLENVLRDLTTFHDEGTPSPLKIDCKSISCFR